MSYPLRIFFVGGLMSFRALFHFMRPSIYVPSMLVAPIFQILLFVYIGRAARCSPTSSTPLATRSSTRRSRASSR
jgi:hypothetical protein